jgi:hypothetical protein
VFTTYPKNTFPSLPPHRIPLKFFLLALVCFDLSLWQSVHASSISLSASGYDSGSGSLAYNTFSRSFSFSGNFFGYSGYGSSTYSRFSDNSIYINGFDFSSGYGWLNVPGFSMSRSGNSYSGAFYSSLLGTNVNVTIFDFSDADGDGVPDLSDGSSSAPAPPLSPIFGSTYYASIALSAPGYDSGSGSLGYSSSRSFSFSGNFFGYDGFGSSSYSRMGDNTIQVNGFDFPTGYGVLSVPTFMMNRSAATYSGSFYSSLMGTYVNVAITDSNDSDGDGIPNLSDGELNHVPTFPISEDAYFFARATVGQVFSWQASASGASSFSFSGLPGGLNGSSGGLISGAPSSPGTSWFSLTASNASGSASRSMVIYVLPPSSALPFSDSFATNSSGRYLSVPSEDARLEPSPGTGRMLFSAPPNLSAPTYGNFVKSTPNLLLPLNSGWEITVEVNLPQLVESGDGAAYQALGLVLIPDDSYSDLSYDQNLISLELGQGTLPWESPDGAPDRNFIAVYGRGQGQDLLTVVDQASPSRVALRFQYQASTKNLISSFRTISPAGTSWVNLYTNSLNSSRTDSLASAWGLASNSSLRVGLWADSFAGNGVEGGDYWLDNFSIVPVNSYPFPSAGGAFASSTTTGYPVTNAFDGATGSPATVWHSQGLGFPHEMGYDFGSAKTVNSIVVEQGWPGSTGNHATSIQVLASTNNADWTDLGTFPGLVFGRNTLTIGSPGSYRYYLLRGLAGPNANWVVQEVAFQPDPFAKTIYVTPTGAGRRDGSSWENAYADLEQAMRASIRWNDEIIMGTGTYRLNGKNIKVDGTR